MRLRSLRTVPRSLFLADRQHRRVLGFMHTHYKGYSYVVNFFFFHSFLCLPRVVFESTSGSASNFSNFRDDRDALVPISLRKCLKAMAKYPSAFRRPTLARTFSEHACNSPMCLKHTSPARRGHILHINKNKRRKKRKGGIFFYATVTPDNFPVSAFSSHSSRNDVSGSAFGRLRERHPLSLHLRARFF